MHLYSKSAIGFFSVVSIPYLFSIMPAFASVKVEHESGEANIYINYDAECKGRPGSEKYKSSCKQHRNGLILFYDEEDFEEYIRNIEYTDFGHSGKHGSYHLIINDDIINIVTTADEMPVVGIDGTDKTDKIINNGTVNLTVLPSIITSTPDDSKVPAMSNPYSGQSGGKNGHDEYGGSYSHEKHSDEEQQGWIIKSEPFTSDAIGVQGGNGHDIIVNNGELNVSSIGAFNNQVGTARTSAVGITGQDGHDLILNKGVLSVHSESSIDISQLSFELIDTGDASRKTVSVSKGLLGGKEHDKLVNKGEIQVTADATINIDQLDINLIGGAHDIDSTDQAWAGALGFGGGEGKDVIWNDGQATVSARASIDSNLVALNGLDILQGEQTSAPLVADAEAIGIYGGEGADYIFNTGLFSVTADALANALNIEISVGDVSSAELSTSAQAMTIGIDGGTGRDKIKNSDILDVTANATADSDSFEFTAVNISNGGTAVSSEASAVGVDGGKDHDFISNSGTLNVTADADSSSVSVDVSLLNITVLSDLVGPSIDSSVTALANGAGVLAGDGHDVVANTGDMTVSANAETSSVDFLWAANFLTNPLDVLEFPELFEAPITDAATTAGANVIGIDSGYGHDAVFNSGVLTANATADVSALRLRVGFPVPDKLTVDFMGYLPSVYAAKVATSSSTTAAGISTGEGHDDIFNFGDVTALSTSIARSNGVAVTVKPSTSSPPEPGEDPPGSSFTLSLGAALVDVSAQADASATGIETDDGHDVVINTGKVVADASADPNAVNVDVKLEQSSATVAVNVALAKAATEGTANAIGITTGSDHDFILNKGEVTARTNADTDSNTVIVDGKLRKDAFLAAGAKLLKSNTEATTKSIGVDAGSGHDVIINKDMITADADSLADANAVDVAITAQTDTDSISLIGEGAWIETDTLARADAEGILGGDGKDKIINSGTVDADAFADPNGVGVAVLGVGTKKGLSAGVALVQSVSKGTANSFAISGGDESDKIYSSGTVKSKAETDVDAVDVAVALTLAEQGVTLSGTAADGSTMASSLANGIDGDSGSDSIYNTGTVDAFSDADAQTVTVGVSAGGATQSAILALGLALSRATTEADSFSSGISGGAYSDSIYSSGLVKSHANTDVVAGSGALAGGGTAKGVTVQGAAADGSTTGDATATGISGDEGKDHVVNEGIVDVLAEADADSVSVAVAANGTSTGVSIGVALARAASEAETTSSGISGGDDNDVIKNTELLKAHSKSNVDAVSVSAAMGGTGTGLALQGAAADASTTSRASSTGISGDSGIDRIYNEGTLDLLADADATSTSVGVSVSGSGTGVSLGFSLALAGTEATSNATGISLGSDEEVTEDDDEHHHDKHKDDDSYEHLKTGQKHDDGRHHDDKACGKHYADYGKKPCKKDDEPEYVENHGKITASSYADANSVSVSAQLGITGAGLQAGAALIDASTTATATAMGIEGSQHKDIIINHDSIEAKADSDSNTTSVGVSLNADLKGATLSVAVTDATATATALSYGIAGLSGDDAINNMGSVTAESKAETDAVVVSVPIGISFVPISVGVATSTAIADADAFGLDGGDGHDFLESGGTILSKSESDAFGISVSVAPIGFSLSDAEVRANATAVGMEGGNGDDFIRQAELAGLTATSDAEAIGTSVSVSFTGASFADLSTNSDAQSTGISGGEGQDQVDNLGSIQAEAKSNTTGTSVSVTLTGATFADASTSSTSQANGISTGVGKDHVFNQGEISTYAESKGKGTVAGAGFTGYFDVYMSTTVTATTAGIALGSNDDEILNKGSMDITAKSNATVSSGVGSLIGVSNADSNITSSVLAQGITGGTGHDLIINKGSITVGPEMESEPSDPWMSRMTSTGFSFNLAGVTSAESSLTSNTRSTGLAGEAGNDHIFNSANLDITATSYSSSTGTSIGIFGTAEGGGDAGAVTVATGISGGDGQDKVKNRSRIDVTSNSYARISGTSFTFGGVGDATGGMGASTDSVGISGGNDMDMLFSEGDITIDAISTLSSNGDSITPFGTSEADFVTGARTTATGIDGGAGVGFIESMATIDVTAKSTVGQSGSSFTFGGTGEAGGTLAADTNATGIRGGDSYDEIRNSATIVTTANSTLNSSGGSVTPFGTSDTDPTSGAETDAMGIDSGDGENHIHNYSLIDVNTGSVVSISGSTFTFGGTGAASGKLTATSNAWGIISGQDADTIWTEGTIDIDATADLSSSNNADTAFGTADAGATSGAEINAFGIESGAGTDHIHNLSLIDITANANVNLNASSYSFGGTSGAGGVLAAIIRATGIAGGEEDDYVYNEGTIDIDASTSLDSSGGANTTFGRSTGRTQVGADTSATGIDAGSGDDLIKNKGTINILSSAFVKAVNSSYVFGGYSETDSVVSSNTIASGIVAGAGDDHIYNYGDIIIDTSSTDTNNGSSYSEFGSSGTAGTVTANSLSKGIDAGIGDDAIINKGKIKVSGLANSRSTHNTDTGFLFGDGDARARAKTQVIGYGIDTGAGDNYVLNEDEITVDIYGLSDSNAKSDGADIFDGDAFSRADATTTGVAIGILAGAGNDTLINDGVITTVTSRIFTIPIINIDIEIPINASSHADADGDGIDGDGTVRSYATNTLTSIGIDAGNGDNFVKNSNTITVNAWAISNATSVVDSDAGGSTSTIRRARVTANGFGIRTGSGQDHVVNKGHIEVRTVAGNNTGNDHVTARATGIATGAGDDVIKNHGTIVTSVVRNGASSSGTSIDSGSGNDTIILANLSSATGNINLGANDDTLKIIDTPIVNGRIYGGSGTDTAVYIGHGTFTNSLESDFEHTIKKGTGTYTLSGLPAMQSITVEQGVLEINSDYEFAAGSTYMPSVSSGEGQGKLVINGSVNISTASINILKGRGHHMDGDKQTVLYASQGIMNAMSFESIKLPEKTPLLAFTHQVTDDEVQVSSSVKPFGTVASTRNQKAIANYLDGQMINAKGDISEALGNIQATSAGGLGEAFDSVNPESYINTQQAFESSIKNYTSILQQRTRGLRKIKQYNAFLQPGFLASVEQGEPLFKTQSVNSLTDALNLSGRAHRRPYGAWAKTFRQNGQLDQSAENSGFEFDTGGIAFGYDKWLNSKQVIGMSLAISQTDLDSQSSHSDVDSQLVSVYSNHITDSWYVDGALIYGYNTYQTERSITISQTNTPVFSEHNGDVYGASLAGGLFFPVKAWDLETYAALDYMQQDEEGFQETGAGGISLRVEPRTSDLLSSELGLRLSRQFKKRSSSLFTDLGMAWVHDFNDDNKVDASFVGSPGSSFTVTGQEIDNDGLLLEAGLSYTNKDGLTGSAEYRTDLRDGYSDQVFFANIQYQFD